MRMLLLVCMVLFVGLTGWAQSPVEVFGYAQTTYTNFSNTWEFGAPPDEADYHYNYMGVNQLNLMLGKDFGNNLTALINFELVNNYSSSHGYGAFSLQEAYVRWEYASWLKVKFGVVIPQFNSMFEIYNKSPLLPYILRPKLYEANQGNMVDIFNILPQKALVHVNGAIPVKDVLVEYSAFLGNPPNDFISSPNNDMIPGYVAYGQSAVSYLSRGGRLGVRYGDVRAGISFASDRENHRRFVKDVDGNEVDLGDIPRTKFGADVTIAVAGFTLSAEYLKVSATLAGATQDSLNVWHNADPYFIGNSVEKEFYYATLQYDISSELFAYAMYDYLNDKIDPFFFGMDGYFGYHLGAGYYAAEAVVLKFQYINNHARYDVQTPVDPIRKFSENQFSFGVSFAF